MCSFNVYFNFRFERALPAYSRAVNLSGSDRWNWMTTNKPVWFIAKYLCEIPHIRLLTWAMERNLTRLDPRSVRAEMTGHRKKVRRKRSAHQAGIEIRRAAVLSRKLWPP